jgi:lipid-binding SYLF domain-containing protein
MKAEFRFDHSCSYGCRRAVAATLPASGQDRGALEADAKRAYDNLIAQVPAAKALAKDAVAVLVFPKIVKAGFMIGAQTGDGVLFRGGRAAGYYNTSGASYGLQAGAEEFGNAMFFMNEKALKTLTETDGFEVGVGPSVTVIDEGMAKSMSTMTALTMSTRSSSVEGMWPASA